MLYSLWFETSPSLHLQIVWRRFWNKFHVVSKAIDIFGIFWNATRQFSCDAHWRCRQVSSQHQGSSTCQWPQRIAIAAGLWENCINNSLKSLSVYLFVDACCLSLFNSDFGNSAYPKLIWWKPQHGMSVPWLAHSNILQMICKSSNNFHANSTGVSHLLPAALQNQAL